MTVILFIDFIVVMSLLLASRRGLENVLPLFCFFLVVSPLESRLVIEGFFDLSTERIALCTLFVLFIAKRGYTRRVPIPLKHLMYLHVFWVLCTIVNSLSVATSIKQLISQVVEYYLLYYIFLKVISQVQTVHRIAYAVVVAVGLCCAFGLLEIYASWSVLSIYPANLWILGDGGQGPLYIEWGRGQRLRSTFPHPILFGDALAMSIPMGLYLLSVCRRQSRRLLLLMITALMFWAIYKTSSRGPWIAVIVSCFLLFLLVRNRVRKYLAVISLLVVLVLLARPGILSTIVNMYLSTMDPSSVVGASYEYRHVLWDTIIRAVEKEPGRMLWGYGLGTFRELGLELSFMDATRRWYTCDNNWAAFLYETGYVGLLIIGALLFKALLSTLRNYMRLPRPDKDFLGVLFISLASFYFLLSSVAAYSWGQQGFMAWILIAMSTVYPRIVVRDHETAARIPANSTVGSDFGSGTLA